MITLPGWFFVWLRKQSKTFDGDVVLKIRKGRMVNFTRSDFWTEQLLYQRFAEERPKEGTDHVGAVVTNGPVDGGQGLEPDGTGR